MLRRTAASAPTLLLGLLALAPSGLAHAFDTDGHAVKDLRVTIALLSASHNPQQPGEMNFVLLIGDDPDDPEVNVFFRGVSNYQGEHDGNDHVTVPLTADSITPGHDFHLVGAQVGNGVFAVGNYNEYRLEFGLNDLVGGI